MIYLQFLEEKGLQNEWHKLYYNHIMDNLQITTIPLKNHLKFEKKYAVLQGEYQALKLKYEELQQQFNWLKRQIFGQKSERFIPVDPSQLEFDLGIDTPPVQEEKVDVNYTRTKVTKTQGHGRQEMPTHLPFKDIVIEPKEDVSDCKHIGDEITWEYDFNPGKLFIRRYIRPKYALTNDRGVTCGTLPNRPIEKGNFGAGIMSSVVTDKYLYHMPLNRQREKFSRQFGVNFAESTFCDLIKHSIFWFNPVYDFQKQLLVKSDYLQADETPMPVLTKDKKGKTHKGFYWVYYDPIRKIVIFEYRKSRSREGPVNFLKDFSGTLQADGYSGYNEVALRQDISRASCMAHVRRKFEDALGFDKKSAEYALRVIGKWFELERNAKEDNLSFDKRLKNRIEYMKEDFASFKKWMMEQMLDRIPNDLIRKACGYAIGQWAGFDVLFKDGKVELSNNLVENAIRPVALGRKNYMFKGSHKAAQRGAIIYSLISTAKLHGKDPYLYLKTLLEKLPNEKANKIQNYLPQNIIL